MIDQSYIAKAVNDALGKDFYVTPFARKAVSPDDIIYVTMTLTRTPFSVKEIDSESLDIYLETAICIENEKYLNATIEKLRNITGYKNLKINVPSKDSSKVAETYTLATFINFNAITEAPFVSQGRYFQIYTLSGNGLITNSKTGGLLANEVLVKLEIEDVSKNISAFIPILH